MLKVGWYTHLVLYFLSDSCKSDCCVDVLAIDHMRNIGEDPWLPMNKSIQNVLL